MMFDLQSIVIAVISRDNSFCWNQLGLVFGTVTFVVAAGAFVVAMVRQVMSAIAPAIIAATRIFAITLITKSTRFSFVVIFSELSCSSTIDSRTTVAIDATLLSAVSGFAIMKSQAVNIFQLNSKSSSPPAEPASREFLVISLNRKKNDHTKLPTVHTKYARGIRYPLEPELEPVPVILA